MGWVLWQKKYTRREHPWDTGLSSERGLKPNMPEQSPHSWQVHTPLQVQPLTRQPEG